MSSMYLSPEHFIQIAAGNVKKTTHINKFGYNASVGTSFETIHDASNLYSYIANAGTATVAGASDSGAVIKIEGLDANYNLLTEDVTVGGTSSGSFIRVYRATVKSLTSGTTNAGNITITVDSAVRATILAGNGQTLMCVYTIPAGKTGYLIKFQGSMEKQKECEFRILTKAHNNGVFNIKGQFGAFGSTVTYDYPVPLKIEEKTDIEIRSRAGATTGMGAIFDIILIDR